MGYFYHCSSSHLLDPSYGVLVPLVTLCTWCDLYPFIIHFISLLEVFLGVHPSMVLWWITFGAVQCRHTIITLFRFITHCYHLGFHGLFHCLWYFLHHNVLTVWKVSDTRDSVSELEHDLEDLLGLSPLSPVSPWTWLDTVHSSSGLVDPECPRVFTPNPFGVDTSWANSFSYGSFSSACPPWRSVHLFHCLQFKSEKEFQQHLALRTVDCPCSPPSSHLGTRQYGLLLS